MTENAPKSWRERAAEAAAAAPSTPPPPPEPAPVVVPQFDATPEFAQDSDDELDEDDTDY